MAARRKKSKKQSATRAEPPLDPRIFFVDRSLGSVHVAARLRAAGMNVERHDDHFSDDTPDVDWIAEVGSRGWVVLTKDKRIRRNPLEKLAVQVAGIRLFTLTGGNMAGEQMGDIFANNRAAIERLARRKKGPFIATVSETAVNVVNDFSSGNPKQQ